MTGLPISPAPAANVGRLVWMSVAVVELKGIKKTQNIPLNSHLTSRLDQTRYGSTGTCTVSETKTYRYR
jgi:hypothetical protein